MDTRVQSLVTTPLVRSPFSPAATEAGAAAQPQDSVQVGGAASAGPQVPQMDERATAQTASMGFGRRFGLALTLGLSGVGAFAGLVPQVAHAQTIAVTQQVQDTRPVRVANIHEVVDNFSAGRQLYIAGQPAIDGRPLSQEEIRHFQDVLKKHPNVFVVLVDRTMDPAGDDNFLSRGIGNSSAFTSVVNKETGEKNGVVFMVYTNVNDNAAKKKIFMRAEELPDRLGVGEKNFTAEDGSPLELMNIFIDGFKNQHKDLAGSLEPVMERINGTIAQEVERTVAPVKQTVAQAQAALDGLKPKVDQFQKDFGKEGLIANPDIAAWTKQMRDAQDALKRHDLNGARQLSEQVKTAVAGQTQAMSDFRQATGLMQEVRAQIDQVKSQLSSLEDNAQAKQAAQHVDAAGRELLQVDMAYRARDPKFAEHLESARSEAKEAAQDVQASRDATTARIEHEANMRKARDGGLGVLALVTLVTLFVLNRRARAAGKKAQAELTKAMQDIQQRSKELMDLLERSDFHEVSAYEGQTKKLADELQGHCSDALRLVGGAAKFLEDAGALIHPKGAKMLKNLVATGEYEKALRLLNSEEPFTMSFADSARAVLEKNSKAATWREELARRGDTREFKKTLQEMLLAMADSRDAAEGILTQIETKRAKIESYLEKVTQAAAASQQSAEKLQASAPDGMFAAKAVTENLLPLVTASPEQGGLLAQGRKLARTDFVQAWDRYAEPAERMASEASKIVAAGVEARQNLMPSVDNANKVLGQHGIVTTWANDATRALSDRLDHAANTSMRTSADAELRAIADDLGKLKSQIAAVMAQDARRESGVADVKSATQQVAAAREEIKNALQQLGAFKSGTAEQVMREDGKDPSARIAAAEANLGAVKARLDVGDPKNLDADLLSAQQNASAARELLTETRQALQAYPGTLQERQTRNPAIKASIDAKYTPSLGRIQSIYNPAVQKSIAGEVGAGETIADAIPRAQAMLVQAGEITAQGIAHFDQAFVLAAVGDLAKADRVLKSAQSLLDAVTSAEQSLAAKQQAAEKELGALDGRFGGTRQHVTQPFVRGEAGKLLAAAETKLAAARAAVGVEKKDPFVAKQALDAAESARAAVEASIEYDRSQFEGAKSAISTADGAIKSAHASIDHAAQQKWNYSSSSGDASDNVTSADLAQANATLTQAPPSVERARQQLQSQSYEDATKSAQSSTSTAQTASQQADAAIAVAQGRFEKSKACVKALEATESHLAATKQKASAEYVRSQAQSALRQAEQQVATARAEVSRRPRNIESARSATSQAETLLSQVESAIQADHAAFDSARSAVSSAENSLRSAQSAVSSASSQSWSWSNSQGSARESVTYSDMSSANSELSQASSLVDRARSQMRSQDYEGAVRTSREADSASSRASSSSSSAVSSAHGRFQSQVSHLERLEEEARRRAEEERRRREEEERRIREAEEARRRAAEEQRQREEEARRAEQRRAEEAREAAERARQSSSSSSSSGGSWGGNGGSGTSSGNSGGSGGSGSRGGDF